MKNLILIGGGGHCKSCIDVIELKNTYKIEGILDVTEKIGQKILIYPIIGTDDEIETYIQLGYFFLITIGQIKSAGTRTQIFDRLKEHNAQIATVISPLAYVSKYSQIGEGTIIMHHALVNANAVIGKNCIINSKALIEHDSIVHDHCHISTGAVVNGNCSIREQSFIGSNSTVVNGISVPSRSFVKAGSLVK